MEPTAAPETASRRAQFLALLAILLLTALVYAASFGFGFVYDDSPQIVTNPRLTAWSFVPSYFAQHVWAQVSAHGTYYRPLFLLWLRLNEALFGVHNPLPWHVTTVLLHLLAVVLVFRLILRTLPNLLAASIATLVFALHPGHVESVAWISGCTEPLMTIALVGSLLCFLRRDGPARILWFSASLVLFVAALLVKETALIEPLLIAVYAFAGDPNRSRAIRSAVLAVIPFAILGAVEMSIRHVALHGGVPDDIHSFVDVLRTVPLAIVFYARHLLWPVHLSPFYDVFLVRHTTPAAFVSAALLSLIIIAGTIFLATRSRTLLIAVAWLTLPVLPALAGIRAFDTTDLVHDRYLYLSTIGLGILLGLAISRIPVRGSEIFGLPAPQFGALALLVVALGVGTTFEIAPWANNLTLFVRGVQVAPKSPPACNHLAFEMYKRGDMASAHRFYRESVTLDPSDWPGSFGLAVLDMRTGNLAEADEYFQRAIALKPNTTNATYVLQAQVRMNEGHLPEAEDSVRKAIAGWPDIAGQHLLLAQILVAEHRPDEARREYRKELDIDPASNDALSGLAALQP